MNSKHVREDRGTSRTASQGVAAVIVVHPSDIDYCMYNAATMTTFDQLT